LKNVVVVLPVLQVDCSVPICVHPFPWLSDMEAKPEPPVQSTSAITRLPAVVLDLKASAFVPAAEFRAFVCT
jgi:hypothetical protein